MKNNFDAIIDLGSKNLKLGIFNNEDKSIYSSKLIISETLEKSLNILIRDAEKYLSSHIDDKYFSASLIKIFSD